MTYHYQAFNTLISSALFFPELVTNVNNALSPDIHIIFGNVSPNGLNERCKQGAFFQTTPSRFWLDIPNIARFLVLDGQYIIIDPCTGVDEESVRVIVLDSCFKALLRQRNCLVLEGSAIEMQGSAVLFLMAPGFGKSTICSLFLKKSYSILSEEICAIQENLNLLPSFPLINLWLNISEQVNIDFNLLKIIRPGIKKYRLDINTNLLSTALPIKLIYLVDYHKKDKLVFTEVMGINKVDRLKAGSFIPHFMPELQGNSNTLFKALAHQVQVIHLTCPRWNYTMNQLGYLLSGLIDTIENDALQRMACHV